MKNKTFKIPQPVLPAPLKPKIPEKSINTTAIIAKIQKILILYPFNFHRNYITDGKPQKYS